jgi:hypothetical protein
VKAGSILALLLAVATTFACTSAETSTSITSPDSDKCQIDVTNAPSAFEAGGGQGTVTITTSRDCAWSLSTSAGWVTAGSATGQGEAAVTYSVAANTVPSERTATIAVSGHTVQLRQSAAPCRYDLRAGGALIGSAGGNLAVTIDTLTGCGWSASSDASWLTITSGQSGNASGTVGLVVAANAGAARVGHAVVGGQTFTVTQDAAGSGSPSVPPPPEPPRTPPPTGGQTKQVDGSIGMLSGHCPNVTFVVHATKVVAGSSTEYRKGDCGDLRNRADVTVTGTVQPNQSLLATRIELKKSS